MWESGSMKRSVYTMAEIKRKWLFENTFFTVTLYKQIDNSLLNVKELIYYKNPTEKYAKRILKRTK